MKITRKNYRLCYDGHEIKNFDMIYRETTFSLADLALSICRDINSELDYEIEYYGKNDAHYLTINGVGVIKMQDDNWGQKFNLLFLNINKSTKKEQVIQEVEKFVEAIKIEIKQMIDSDFDIEMTIKGV